MRSMRLRSRYMRLFKRILALQLDWVRMREWMPASCIFESKPESRVNQFINSDLEPDRSSFPPYDQRTFALSRRAARRRGVCGFRVALLHRSDQRGFVL